MDYRFADAGKARSSRPLQKSDCAIRAIALISGRDYDKVYDDFKEQGRKCSRGTAKHIWKNYLADLGFKKHSFPAVAGKSRMSLERFAVTYRKGKFVVQMAKHLTAVVDGVVLDTFEPIPYKCVYAVWEKS